MLLTRPTRRRSGVVWVGLGLALVAAGCSSSAPPLFKGVLRLSWTIQGQSASDATCASVDHLVITVESTPSLGVEIEPVACAHGVAWERDDVPVGSDVVLVDAVDLDGRTNLEAMSKIGVTEAEPATPTVVDLQPL